MRWTAHYPHPRHVCAQLIAARSWCAHRTEFKFRSYDPSTGQARRHIKAVDEAETVESATRDVIREALQADEERRKQELDLFNIQPKKPNWDLRRDLDKRLEKLKPKTQAAINTLIRQRLGQAKGKSGTQASAGGEDMAEAVGRRTINEEEGAMSDEDAL